MTRMTATADQIYEVMRSEHRDIEELIAKVKDNRGAARGSAFTALRRFLAVHTAAEEIFVHSGSPFATERLRKEGETREVIAHLEAIDPGAPAFESAFAKFAAKARDHAVEGLIRRSRNLGSSLVVWSDGGVHAASPAAVVRLSIAFW